MNIIKKFRSAFAHLSGTLVGLLMLNKFGFVFDEKSLWNLLVSSLILGVILLFLEFVLYRKEK